MPAAKSAGSKVGAPASYTDDGPPERTIAFGFFASISEMGIDEGTISEYTCAWRTRRAMSCAYCAPKSTTKTVSRAELGTIDDDLYLLELLDI